MQTMTIAEYIAAAQGLVAIYNALQKGKPPTDNLTPAEKEQVDAANLAINTAVGAWDAAGTL